MLRALEVDAVALREQYPQGISDVSLLAALRGSGCVFITADRSQKTREQEARALIQSGITSLFLGAFWTKKTFWDQAIWMLLRWRRLDGFASSVQPGACADVSENGKAKPFYL